MTFKTLVHLSKKVDEDIVKVYRWMETNLGLGDEKTDGVIERRVKEIAAE